MSPTWENVASGTCDRCEHEIVDFREPGRLRLSRIVSSRRGDCKEFALVLRHLLARHGVESESALVKLDSTAVPHRRIPGPSDFDHVVVHIPALDRYIDATLGDPAAIRADARSRFAYAIHAGDGQFSTP